jgi:hypothetical protein
MGFSGGGGSQTLPHTHDSNIINDGGALQFNNVTQGGMGAGDVTYSDGNHLQVLTYPAIPAGETLTAAAASTAPSWVAGGAAGIWTATTASAATLQAELSVTITGNPDIIQVLYNVCGDNATTSILGLRLNNHSASDYNSRVMGFYQTFDYDVRTSKSEWWVDRGTPDHNRVGEILIFKGNPNFDVGSASGNVGWCFRNSSSESAAGAATSPSYICMSGGSNENLTGNVTSLQMLFQSGDILGNIQVNSMQYT